MPSLGTFWEILTKKTSFFFGARSRSKLLYIGTEGDLDKNRVVRPKMDVIKYYQRGPFGM